jgi:site-specific recombinase XerD
VGKTSRRQAGDGALYQRADGMWIGSVDLGFTPEGKRRRKTVSHRTQAGALAKLREVRRQVGIHGDIPTRSQTLSDWLDRWMREIAVKRVRPRTFDTYGHKVRLIKEAIGRTRLDKLTPAHVRQMHTYITTKDAARGGTLSSTTALQAHRILAKALKDAEREGLVTRNVASLVDAPAKAASTRGALTSAQAKAVLTTATKDPMAARWALALLYGVRQGESLGLSWNAVDLDAGTIDLAWQLQRLTWRHGCGTPATCGRKRGAECPARHIGAPDGFEVRPLDGALCLTRPKSHAGTRVLPLIEAMRVLLERQAELTADQPNPHGLVWHQPDGRPLDSKADRAAWYAALDAAGAPRVELHCARHTTATLLLELGVDATVIAAILGHSDVVTTRGYQHVDLSLSRAAVESLGRVLTA